LEELKEDRGTIFFFFLYLAVFLALQHRLGALPFSTGVSIDFRGNVDLAMDITNLEQQFRMDVYAFPRLFHLPISLAYKLFSLSRVEVAYLMYLAMFLSLLADMALLKRLGGHAVGLFCIPIMISYGSYANVIGISFLLYYVLRPSLLVFLALGFGYPFLAPLLVPLMAVRREYKNLIAGSLILLPYAYLLLSRNFGTLFNEPPARAGIFNAILPYEPAAPLWLALSIYLLFLLPVAVRAVQSLKFKKYYPDLTMPLTAVTAALLITYLGLEPGLIYKYMNVLPIFSTITLKCLVQDCGGS